MECGCPVCNGLAVTDRVCPECGETMEDGGMVEDYYGPYSPYDDMDLYEQPEFWEMADEAPCVHLFTCPKCGYDERVGFRSVVM